MISHLFEKKKMSVMMIGLDDAGKSTVAYKLAPDKDLPNAMNITEITDELCLQSVRYRNWVVQGISASKGDGIDEGLEWLIDQVERTKIEANHRMYSYGGHESQNVETYQDTEVGSHLDKNSIVLL
ncbi:ADP-ribosylation factor 3-like [Planococcus citri]|uniref:ADP-ribosylation factor 3-like n=1 Tax=Planococcus citri TaxID=170843 RepID=UPI0031F9E15F